MRFVIVTSSFPSGPDDSANAGVFVREVAERLAADGHEVDVVCPADRSDDTTAERAYALRPIHWLGSERSLTHLNPKRPADALKLASVMAMGLFTVAWQVRRRKADRVIAFWAVPSGLWARLAKAVVGVPYDVWALGSDIWRIDDYPMGRRGLQAVLRSADRCFGDGTDLVDQMKEIAGRNAAFLASSRTLPDPTRVPTPATVGVVRITSVGRFHPHKGMDVLLEAIATLRPDELERLVVTINGFGPDADRLEELIARNRLEATVTLGGVLSAQELRDLLVDTDLAVVPSRIESIPLILSDYAQSDVPLLVTDTGDMGSLVREHDAGMVVAADDVPALAAGLRAILDAPASDRSITGTSSGRAALAHQLGLARSVAVLSDPSNDLGRSPGDSSATSTLAP